MQGPPSPGLQGRPERQFRGLPGAVNFPAPGLVSMGMMRILLASLLVVSVAPAMPWVRFNVVDEWRIEGRNLRATARAGQIDGENPSERVWEIRTPDVAKSLAIKEEEVAAYLKGLDPRLPLLVEYGDNAYFVAGVWCLSAERMRKELRVELSPTLEVKLMNAGKAVHRVVKPNDGSESGWREPEIFLEREVDGKWVRGGKPGRCGLYAHDWQEDIVDLKPGEALPLEGYLSVEMSFGLAKPYKAKVRAVYVYRGGHLSKAGDGEPDPGAMGKTPPFTLVSEPVEIDAK